jgi:phosphoribosylglycinamide formyltransferase 1
MKKLAIFSSGTGSNAARIIEHFRDHPAISVSLIVCNNPKAGVLIIAKESHIPVLLIEKEQFFRGNAYLPELREKQIDFIVLAGFLWKIPLILIKAYPKRIVNIHPALLPKYGGKGMYGHFVHDAVIAAGESESGITIHFVDELYDHGKAIFRKTVAVERWDTPDSLAKKIQALEHEFFPQIIEQIVKGKKP